MNLVVDCHLVRTKFTLDVNLSIPARSVLAIRGENGSGKTSTLDMIAGLLPCTSGSIRLGDTVLDDSTTGDFVQPEHRGIATVFQSGGLFPHLTVERNVAFGRGAAFIGTTKFDEIVDAFDIRGFLRRKPHELSGGQRQRVALARAFLSPSDVLLLDEPTTFLDAQARTSIRSLMKEAFASYPGVVVLVSHDEAETNELATAVAHVEVTRGDTTVARINCRN